MTSKRVLLYFFDIEDFLIDFNGEIEDFERVSEDRIESIESIEASGVFGRDRNSVSIFVLTIVMSIYRNTHEMYTLYMK